jgi:hypothetical protein
VIGQAAVLPATPSSAVICTTPLPPERTCSLHLAASSGSRAETTSEIVASSIMADAISIREYNDLEVLD